MIPRIKKILYATDLTKNSAYAFRYAVNTAQKHDAEIHIFHVVEALSPQTMSMVSMWFGPDEIKTKYGESIKHQAQRIESRIREFARRELQKDPETLKRIASIQVMVGNPSNEILKKMEDLKGDILVLGMHGRDIFKQTFLGSVSKEILQRIRKPVFIIPIPEEDTDMSMDEI